MNTDEYRRRTATAARITAARQEQIRLTRAENRRLYGPSTGGPALTRERAVSAFPGFPALAPKYQADLAEAGTDTWGILRSQATLAKVRDLATDARLRGAA